MKTTFTPGPWELFAGTTAIAVNAPNRKTLHYNAAPELGRDEAIANARLIAAAPDLLAALIQCEHELQAICRREPRNATVADALENARAAIAKATQS